MVDRRLADVWQEAAFGAEQADKRPFDPFAANVLLSPVDSLKLAGLEAMGAPVMRRLTSPSRDDPDGERARERRADFIVLELLVRQQQWDAQLVTIGGVQMTNAEAQAARQRILDNPDEYVAWAREQGLIHDGEEAAFLETVRRLHELNELERNDRLTTAQRQEWEELQQSPLGQAAAQTTGQAHVDKGRQLEAVAEQAASLVGSTENATQRHNVRVAVFAQSDPSLPGGEPGYADQEPITPCFNACVAGNETAVTMDGPTLDERPPTAPDRGLSASGLDL